MSIRRVMVVDDSPVMREVARLGLGTIGGLEVTTVASGETALERAAAAPPDAILLDVDMPGLSGPETLTRLRADPLTHAIPVVLVTASDAPSDRARFALMDIAGVIEKPFDVADLAGRIAELVGWTA